ncbi:MAG: NAD(P)H-dependent oxidoreductase [Ferruginibacter sp.]|nr:NAD(P)H-dependent oxidoreductase [Ferruginibacter sp.]
MITIIAGTNRKDSNTKKVAKVYHEILSKKKITCQLLSLDEVNVFERNNDFEMMENAFLKKADMFIFIVPEYHGSYPGIFKLMLDNSDAANVWTNKKVLLTGVSSGRAGNLRGLEHLTGTALHLKMIVHPNRLPISVVHTLVNSNNKIDDKNTLAVIEKQLEEFLLF